MDRPLWIGAYGFMQLITIGFWRLAILIIVGAGGLYLLDRSFVRFWD